MVPRGSDVPSREESRATSWHLTGSSVSVEATSRACPVVGTQETQKLILRSVIAKSNLLRVDMWTLELWFGQAIQLLGQKEKGK